MFIIVISRRIYSIVGILYRELIIFIIWYIYIFEYILRAHDQSFFFFKFVLEGREFGALVWLIYSIIDCLHLQYVYFLFIFSLSRILLCTSCNPSYI